MHAIWNGATEVARWTVLGGPHPGALHRLGATRWNGFDTSITLSTGAGHIAVVAEDEEGHQLEESALVPVAPN